jgi:hypothetical protein
MDYLHTIAVLLALVGVVPALTLASPIKVQHRAIPSIMIALALVLWFLPTGIDLALACVPLAAWISARLGIEHAGHEPANYDPAVEAVKDVAKAARERIRPSEPVEVTRYVTKAYPAPDDQDDESDSEEDDVNDTDATAEDAEASPAEPLSDKLDSLAADPALPAGLRNQLAVQRSGRIKTGGLRSATTQSAIRSFVPSLLD